VALIELPKIPTVLIDVAAWGLIHAVTGYLVHRMNNRRLDHDTWLTTPRTWERSGRIYERVAIRRWKDKLPEAGAIFAGGVSKKSLPASHDSDLLVFATETRRAEVGHFLAAAASPLFFVWNSVPVGVFMVVYGIGVNVPFIAIQRYNRLRIARLLARRSRMSRVGRPGDAAPSSWRVERGTTGNNMP